MTQFHILMLYQDKLQALKSGMCGFDMSFVTDGGCVSVPLKRFNTCARDSAMPHMFYNAPFVHSLFARPSPALARCLIACIPSFVQCEFAFLNFCLSAAL